jgi:cell wall-associated NlpC family hydrolase
MFSKAPSVCRTHRSRKVMGCAAVAVGLAAASLQFAPSASAAETKSITIPKKCGTAYDGVKFNVPNNWRAKVIEKAIDYCGVPYEFGGTNKGGIDCSGLVMKAYRVEGKNPFKVHKADTQMRTKGLTLRTTHNGDDIGGKDGGAVAGDIVGKSESKNGRYHHIGIFIGWSGGKAVYIHAPHTGTVVKVAAVGTGEHEHFKNPDKLMS